jgi:hypothetical protein
MPKDKALFDRREFQGSVVLKEWWTALDGGKYLGISGTVSILTDSEIVGFEVNDRDSKWVARVEGPTESVVVLGCQVRGVHVHERTTGPRDYYEVP